MKSLMGLTHEPKTVLNVQKTRLNFSFEKSDYFRFGLFSFRGKNIFGLSPTGIHFKISLVEVFKHCEAHDQNASF